MNQNNFYIYALIKIRTLNNLKISKQMDKKIMIKIAGSL